jgi:hypothetical protein
MPKTYCVNVLLIFLYDLHCIEASEQNIRS